MGKKPKIFVATQNISVISPSSTLPLTTLMVHTQMHILLPLREQEQVRADFFQTCSSSAAPAHCTRDAGTAYLPDLGAELGQVVLLQVATPHAPHVQHITDNRCATCRMSRESQWSPPQLQTWSQLTHGDSRLRSIGYNLLRKCSALSRACST